MRLFTLVSALVFGVSFALANNVVADVGVFGTSRFGSAQWAEPLDTDNDGVSDSNDVFPNDPTETSDFDGDGIGDNADPDDDNDGVEDSSDALPFDATETVDTDDDGIGNNADTDDDNDGLSDAEEGELGTDPLLIDTDSDGVNDLEDEYPLDPNESADSDGDGVGDNSDWAPNDSTESVDTDGDGEGNNADIDDDNDGISDLLDPEPLIDNTAELEKYELVTLEKTYSSASTYAAERGAHLATISSEKENALIYAIVSKAFSASPWTFKDVNDGGDVAYVWLGGSDSTQEGTWTWETEEAFSYTNWGSAEPDNYNDNQDSLAMGLEDWPSWLAGTDSAYGKASEWNDISEDNTIFFVMETEGPVVDTDGDGIIDSMDAFPNDPTETTDSDSDGVGDNADAFPNDASETTDSDGDGVGDNSDWAPNDWTEIADSDGDGVGDNADDFPDDSTEQLDTDGDGIGNNTDTDDDGDGIPDVEDYYPLDPLNFRDTDGDGVDDLFDFDDDNDGVPDSSDPHPLDPSLPFTERHIVAYGEFTGTWDGDYSVPGADFESGITNSSDLDVEIKSWQILDGENIEKTSISSNIASDGVLSSGESTAFIARFTSSGILSPVSAVYTLVNPNTGDYFTKVVKFTPQGIDRDGDGVLDEDDLYPDNVNEWVDSDGDGIGDNQDQVPSDPKDYLDSDNDGVGDSSDPDIDGDGVINTEDPFPNQAEYSADSDGDGMPDAWETRYNLNPNDPSDAAMDEDGDGITNLNEFLAGTPPSGSLDIDGNGQYDALTDGLLLLRGMFGLTDSALIAGTVSSDALYSTSEEIQSQISLLGDLADIDGNGDIDALTDGLLTLRYLFGLEGDSLIAGVIAENATRSNATEIEVYLETLTPDIQ